MSVVAALNPSFTESSSDCSTRLINLFELLHQPLVSILERVASVDRSICASVVVPFTPSVAGYVGVLDERFCEISEGEFISREYSLRAYQVIEQYRALEDGWDGDQALAPTIERLDAAETFLRMLVSNIDVCPEVGAMLDEEGVPGLFWDTGRAYFSVSFYDACDLVCVYCNRETAERDLFEADLFKPEEVAQVLEYIESLQ